MIEEEIKKCLVADDHWISRKGLIYTISKKFDNFTFDEASSLDEIIERLKENKYDLLLFDFDYSDNNIASRIELIMELAPEAKIVIITSLLTYFQFFTLKIMCNL